jgi:acyl carrier protein
MAMSATAPTQEQVLESVRSIASRLVGVELGATTSLIEEGLLDSVNLVSLIAELDGLFGTKTPDTSIKSENFASPTAIAQLYCSQIGNSEEEPHV